MKTVVGLRVGWGEQTYEVNPNWARLPANLILGPVTSVAASPDGRIYLCHRFEPSVLILDPAGAVVGSLGDGEVIDPHGITTDLKGNIYVADRDRHVVVVFGPDGKLIKELGTRDHASPEAPFNHPADVAVAADGTTFVADGYGNSRIHVFSADGRLIRSWGEAGRGPGQFSVPHGIAVDSRNRVYVADRENDRVQVFDLAGTLLDVWDAFRGPTDVSIDERERIFVSDHIPTVTALDTSGRVLVKIRAYHDTHGVCCDRAGNVFVASTAGRSVIKYTPVGHA